MKKDQFVIACVEDPEGAELLIPWARHFAERLNGKGLLLLNVSKDGESDWLKEYGLPYIGLRGDWKTAIDGLPTALGGILAVTAVNGKAPRNSITHPRTLLREFRDCKIAYLVLGYGLEVMDYGGLTHHVADEGLRSVHNPSPITHNPFTALLTLDYRRESKEKLIWASYLVRFLGAQLTVALPDYRDGGLRAQQTNNLRYMEKIAPSLGLTYTTSHFPLPTFRHPDVEAVEALRPQLLLTMTTDRRDRDVGDWLLGAPELKLLQCGTPVLLLNQRDDLYVLCD